MTSHDGFETLAIHAGQEPDPGTGAVVPPIYQVSTFKQDGVGGLRGGYEYSRSANPTRTALEQCLAEHPEGAGELRPLAGVVSEIRVDAAAMPETARLRGRAQLLAAISSNGHRPAEEASVLAQMRRAFWLPRWAAAVGAGLSLPRG